MRRVEIEAWALRVIDAVKARRPSEWDERVQLKARWIEDSHELARRIAGHANASRGEPILWLFGVDENGASVPGIEARDPSTWWPQVLTHLDGQIAPSPTFVTVPYEGVVVAALYLETDGAPFVVRNAQFGNSGVKVQWEVPWSANASIRTARREDLIRMLVPAVRVPTLEIEEIEASASTSDGPKKKLITIEGSGYLVHLTKERLHIPDAKATGTLRSAGGAEMLIVGAKLTPMLKSDPASGRYVSANSMFERNDHDLLVLGPGQLNLRATARLEKDRDAQAFDDFGMTASVLLDLKFVVLGADAAIRIRAWLAPKKGLGSVAHAWRLDPTRPVDA